MNVEVLPVMLEVLNDGDVCAIREVIDAIGYMCSYCHISNERFIIEKLLNCFDTYKDDEMIRWKVVQAFSAFHDEKIAAWLKE